MKKAKAKATKEPTARSLKAIPEIDFTAVTVRRNPYAARIAESGMSVNIVRGRPPRGRETGSTTPRSIRFTNDVWQLLEHRAKEDGVPLHAALRAAVMVWANAGRRKSERANSPRRATGGPSAATR
jgi:hypothetical protein